MKEIFFFKFFPEKDVGHQFYMIKRNISISFLIDNFSGLLKTGYFVFFQEFFHIIKQFSSKFSVKWIPYTYIRRFNSSFPTFAFFRHSQLVFSYKWLKKEKKMGSRL